MIRKYLGKEYIERAKKFDKIAYNKQYQKEHYSSFSCRIDPKLKERVDKYCEDTGISKAEFLRRAIDMFENDNK